MGRKKNYPLGVRDFLDADYLDKLSDEEREFYVKFEQGYYGNDHRNSEILTGKGYDKKEADKRTNGARRDLYSKNTRVSIRSNDISNILYDSYSSDISDSLKYKGLEKTIKNLIESTAFDILQYDEFTQLDDIKEDLHRLCIDVTKALQLEKKYRRNQRRKK